VQAGVLHILSQEIQVNGRSIGLRLAEALTKKQMVHLLDTAFRLWDKKRIKELISAVAEDVASTVSRLLESKSPPRERVVSDSKIMEEWGGLWAKCPVSFVFDIFALRRQW
jgi:hypothetical protein